MGSERDGIGRRPPQELETPDRSGLKNFKHSSSNRSPTLYASDCPPKCVSKYLSASQYSNTIPRSSAEYQQPYFCYHARSNHQGRLHFRVISFYYYLCIYLFSDYFKKFLELVKKPPRPECLKNKRTRQGKMGKEKAVLKHKAHLREEINSKLEKLRKEKRLFIQFPILKINQRT